MVMRLFRGRKLLRRRCTFSRKYQHGSGRRLRRPLRRAMVRSKPGMRHVDDFDHTGRAILLYAELSPTGCLD